MDLSHWCSLLWSVLVFAVLGEMWLILMVVHPMFGRIGKAEHGPYHKFYGSRSPGR